MRGARGGFARGGPRGGRKAPNGTSHDAFSADESLDDQGELGEMKKKYAAELAQLKEMFPDWTDVDLVFALQETDGDMMSTIDHITQGKKVSRTQYCPRSSQAAVQPQRLTHVR